MARPCRSREAEFSLGARRLGGRLVPPVHKPFINRNRRIRNRKDRNRDIRETTHDLYSDKVDRIRPRRCRRLLFLAQALDKGCTWRRENGTTGTGRRDREHAQRSDQAKKYGQRNPDFRCGRTWVHSPGPVYAGLTNPFPPTNVIMSWNWGRKGSTESDRAPVASRGAAGLVKSGKKVNANNNLAYAA